MEFKTRNAIAHIAKSRAHILADTTFLLLQNNHAFHSGVFNFTYFLFDHVIHANLLAVRLY